MPYAELAKNGIIGTHRFPSAGCDVYPLTLTPGVKVKEGRSRKESFNVLHAFLLKGNVHKELACVKYFFLSLFSYAVCTPLLFSCQGAISPMFRDKAIQLKLT